MVILVDLILASPSPVRTAVTAPDQCLDCSLERRSTETMSVFGSLPVPLSIATDSYKAGHFAQYPDVPKVKSYCLGSSLGKENDCLR